jgi:CHASE3 domain sensor protein
MPSQRIILGIGLAILLLIGAASVGLDLKSRSDTGSVDHTLLVLTKISDLRLLLRGAESAARGFALNGDPNLLNEYQESGGRIASAFAGLAETIKDNPSRTQLLKDTEALVAQRLAVSSEVLRLQSGGETA